MEFLYTAMIDFFFKWETFKDFGTARRHVGDKKIE